jgi:hypothetical protein
MNLKQVIMKQVRKPLQLASGRRAISATASRFQEGLGRDSYTENANRYNGKSKLRMQSTMATNFEGAASANLGGSLMRGMSSAAASENPHSRNLVYQPPGVRSMNEIDPRVSILAEVIDEPGALYQLLALFWKYDIQLTSIESRPVVGSGKTMTIYMSFQGHRGEEGVAKLVRDLRDKCRDIFVLDEKVVPWFPRHVSDLDKVSNRVIDGGEGGAQELQADHPGFTDKTYVARRMHLADVAMKFKWNEPIPHIDYTESENETWGVVYVLCFIVFPSFRVCDLSRSITACLHSLTPHNTSLTIIPSLNPSIINPRNTHIAYYTTGTTN